MTVKSEPQVLAIGMMIGGAGSTTARWERAVKTLLERVRHARRGIDSPLRVNVVYQIPGSVIPTIDFVGVRTGRYSAADRHLLVQVALPSELPAEPDTLVFQLLLEAVDAAAEVGRRKGLAADLPALRALVRSIA